MKRDEIIKKNKKNEKKLQSHCARELNLNSRNERKRKSHKAQAATSLFNLTSILYRFNKMLTLEMNKIPVFARQSTATATRIDSVLFCFGFGYICRRSVN